MKAILKLHFTLQYWHLVAAGLAVVLSVWACAHVILFKKDTRAALGWIGLILWVPLVGPVLYFVFGINRLRREAVLLRGGLDRFRAGAPRDECTPEELHHHLPAEAAHLNMLARVVGDVVQRPLLKGNQIEPLLNGDEAYPAMIEAIEKAQQTLSLQTYIFDRDEAGLAFVRALGEAVRRGVQVRVLIDAAGVRYSWPSIGHALHHAKVPFARFLPSLVPWRVKTLNLRTHRKILVADGNVGFTGGMNIRVGNCLRGYPRFPVQDIHFRLRGPVVTQLQEAFADDWLFTTGEALRESAWFAHPEAVGTVLARGILDGPDEDYAKLRWTILGALNVARQSVRIVTPYFLPDTSIVSALNLAALRGVQVDIVLPSQNNLRLVHWASRAMWWQVLEHGCRIWLSPPPFDHSKLMIVDDCWVLVGSANWDARSLRLNFEFNVECYDPDLARRMGQVLEKKRAASRQVTLQEVDGRSLPCRFRDGLARLLTPYL